MCFSSLLAHSATVKDLHAQVQLWEDMWSQVRGKPSTGLEAPAPLGTGNEHRREAGTAAHELHSQALERRQGSEMTQRNQLGPFFTCTGKKRNEASRVGKQGRP